MFIGVAGLIGAGKSTLTKSLADRLGYKAYFEPVETNPYLADFYKDISRWTFNMQMFLLAHRFRQHQEVIWDSSHAESGGVVQDRTIYEDTIFARIHNQDGLMDDRDYTTYSSHFNIMKRYLVYPDLLVYLHVPPDLAFERIKMRSRDVESGIPMEYLVKLYNGYEQFAEEMDRYCPVLRLDWTEFRSTDEVLQQIQEKVRKNEHFMRSLRRI